MLREVELERKLGCTMLFGALILAASLLASGGAQSQAPSQGAAAKPATATQTPAPTATDTAVAMLQPTAGSQVQGRVTFRQDSEGVHVVAELSGLSPGKHGFHVHEFGDCSAPDASSAGGHFNPLGSPHGAPDNPPDQRHVGDLGNIEADADGNGFYERVDKVISLHGENSIIGKSVIVHADPDDLVTQPTGNAGARVACGTIEWAKPDQAE
jgi:Cu-Zn family superoxide dismutase